MWLFADSERGAERAAFMYTLIQPANEATKLNEVYPQTWLADVLARIADIPQTRLSELLPWNCAPLLLASPPHRGGPRRRLTTVALGAKQDMQTTIAERALRHAVIARRVSFSTRTDEGSRFYAAALSVIETCRKRGLDTWRYAASLIAAARAGLPASDLPTRAVA